MAAADALDVARAVRAVHRIAAQQRERVLPRDRIPQILETHRDLHEIILDADITDGRDNGLVDVPIREILNQIAEEKYSKFFFQEFGSLRPYSFKVFNRI